MKFSEKWLREWVNPPISREKLASQLVLAGLEVESITPADQDVVFELSLTPNRGDCLSIAGIAREVAAINRMAITMPKMADIAASITDTLSVNILLDAAKACPRYAGRIIRNINPAQSTPDWILQRLLASGIEPKMPVVDILNYVMLELGQPMHAFDLAALDMIQVRMAKAGEKIKLLNDQTVELQVDTLVIADSSAAQAIAGVMGSAESAIKADTRDIFLESAFFDPLAIVGQARKYGLQTDSAYRFERGVDPQLQERAIERATALLLEIVGGTAGRIILKESTQHLPVLPIIELRASRIEQILGIAISHDEIIKMLRSLNMQVNPVAGKNTLWQVIPPSYRFDIRIEADLIEEIVRLYGYESVQLPPPPNGSSLYKRGAGRDLSRFRQVVVNRGYREAITYSFVDPKLQQALTSATAANFELANPISPELSVMRTSLWPGLLTALQYNYNRQQSRIRLFETGLRFTSIQQQELMLSGVIMGSVNPEQWGMPARPVDFFDLKGDMEALLALTGDAENFVFEKWTDNGALHPQQSSCIKRNGREIGWLGRLNPAIQKILGVAEPIFLFELMLSEINQVIKAAFKPLPKFPSMRRDIALLVDKSISADQIKQTIQATQKNNAILDQILFFDVYEGKGVPPLQKSVALGLSFQHPTRTLTDEEVNVQMGHIIAILETSLKAVLRK